MNRLMLPLFLGSFLASGSFADTVVKVYNRCDPPLCTCNGAAPDATYTFSAGLTAATVPALATCVDKVVIEAPQNEQMRRIVLTGGPAFPSAVKISIGATFNEIDLAPGVAGSDWGGLDASGIAVSKFYGGINGSLKGGIRVTELYRFDAGGMIEAAIQADRPGSSGVCVVEAGGFASGSSFKISSGNILRVVSFGTIAGDVEATDGNILSLVCSGSLTGFVNAPGANASIVSLDVSGDVTGRVYAEQGSFGDLIVDGALSSPDSPGGIWPIRSKNGINRLIAGSITANITAATNGGLGKVGLIKTTNGPMTKGLALKELITPVGGGEAGIIINGSLPTTASIRFLPGAPRTRNILVRDSFAGEIRYDHPAALDTQIVVNAGNTGGVWTNTGKVILNSNPPPSVTPITLSTTEANPLYQGPNYDATPSQLGGGSIGVVPFALHDLASSPANPPMGVPPTPINMGAGSVVLEFYGPIRAETTNDPIEIVFVSTTWPVAVVATDWFNWSISGRTLTVVRDPAECLPPGSYTITPNRTGSDRLLCNVAGLTGGASVAVADFDYLFEVNGSGSGCPCYTVYECAPCAADFDNNGGVDGGDLAAFFLNYEQGCPCADVDGNGGVDGGDLGFFFAAYEAGGC